MKDNCRFSVPAESFNTGHKNLDSSAKLLFITNALPQQESVRLGVVYIMTIICQRMPLTPHFHSQFEKKNSADDNS